MIAGREHLKVLEEYAAQQVRIYPDACDVGVWIEARMLVAIREACRELSKIYKGKTERWSTGSSWECFVPYEQEGGRYMGARVKVSRNRTRRNKEFMTIEINRDSQEESPFK